jgi:hypothetical protein
MKNEISTRVKKMAILMISCSFLTGFSACIPEEMAVAPHPLGDATLRSLSIGADYQKQVFYNIEKNEIISENLKSDWDLAFDCSDSSDYVLLNQAKFMSAWIYKTPSVSINIKKQTQAIGQTIVLLSEIFASPVQKKYLSCFSVMTKTATPLVIKK